MNRVIAFLRWNSGLILVALVVTAWPSRAADTAPGRQQFLDQAERCRKILKTSLIDFYLPACVDRTNGGYLESLRDGKFAPAGEKFLTLQARQLWFFSTLALEDYERERALVAARTGFTFLQTRMFDPEHGGYFSKVSDEGTPRDTRKHVYLNSFALYALVAYYRASQDPAALDAAKRLFGVLEERAHDSQYGGYIEFFYADWRPVTDPKEQGFVGAIGHKTYNTHLHLLESIAELYRVWPDPVVRRRLQELIAINTSTVRMPRFECNVDAFLQNWHVVETPQNLRASYGHDVECAWLTLDAVKTLGAPANLFRSWAEALCESSLKFGYDREHGGFFSTGPLGEPATDTKKVWWVEAEALVSMLDMYQMTKKETYYSAFAQTLDFVEQHQVAGEGSWWASRAADGSSTGDLTRTGPWQGGYHAGRAMLLCAKRLQALANGTEAF